MTWRDKIFAYCERGSDPGFWAEPLNAISNASFILAGFLASALWLRQNRRAQGITELLLILLVLVIGIGSFMFHTFATRWARIADSAPIALFMISYLGYAIRRFLNAGWITAALSIAVFLSFGAAASTVRCGSVACLNGSIAYLPALAALIVVASLLAARKHAAAKYFAAGSAVFAVSLGFRSADLAICPMTLLRPGWYAGTHAAWHMLNGMLLYLLLAAGIRCGQRPKMSQGIILK